MRSHLLILPLLFACCTLAAPQSTPPAVPAPPTPHDGARDFNPLLGNFNFHLHFMLHPLTPTPDWIDMDGTGACYKAWDGRAQLDTIELDSSSGGHMEGLTYIQILLKHPGNDIGIEELLRMATDKPVEIVEGLE